MPINRQGLPVPLARGPEVENPTNSQAGEGKDTIIGQARQCPRPEDAPAPDDPAFRAAIAADIAQVQGAVDGVNARGRLRLAVSVSHRLPG